MACTVSVEPYRVGWGQDGPEAHCHAMRRKKSLRDRCETDCPMTTEKRCSHSVWWRSTTPRYLGFCRKA